MESNSVTPGHSEGSSRNAEGSIPRTSNPEGRNSNPETSGDRVSDNWPPIRQAPVKPSVAGDVINVIRGFCMGAADTVPGVSGGTVALILGHYERLVHCISQFDVGLLQHLFARRVGEAAKHIDLRFLAALGTGIGIGVVTLSGLMHWLLDHRMPQTLAVFLGLMIASVLIVKSYIKSWTMKGVLALMVGIASAIAITMMPIANGGTSLPYLFVSGAIAICAMILPGISGAFVLLLFGVYHHVTGTIKEATRGNFSIETLTQIFVFAAGCGIGLLSFTKVLKWLLAKHHDITMCALMGLMIGSLGKLWPLQVPTAETAGMELKFRIMEYISPANFNGSLLLLVGLTIVSAVAVIVIENFAGASEASN